MDIKKDIISKCFDTYKTITPEESKKFDNQVFYGHFKTSFGICFVAIAEKDVCFLSFIDNQEVPSSIKIIKDHWPKAKLIEDQQKAETFIKNIFFEGEDFKRTNHLLLRGTEFQIKVWKSLATIPEGKTTSYENIAKIINKPTSIRAVANAISKNPISYIIPCHRIISKNGNINKYRWGALRKKALLDYEANLQCN